MTVLITRPIEDSKILADELVNFGIASFIEPMFHVKHLFPRLDLDFKTIQGVIFTSRHAVMPIKELETLPCFVVGSATAQKAKECGFQKVILANGNIKSLLHEVEANYIPNQGALLYLRGSLVTMDIVRFFKNKNTQVIEEVVYQTEEIKTLSANLLDRILAKEIETAVFFSENTVKIFIGRFRSRDLLNLCGHIHYFALSEKVANSLKEAGVKQIRIFNDNTNLTKLLREYYRNEENK